MVFGATMNRLLIIEDSDLLRDSLEQGLREAGYDVAVAADGPSGFNLAVEGAFDIIILDLMLPGLDGLSLLRQLRQIQSRQGAFVLILTSRDTPNDRVKGLDSGADDYLIKPFEFAELLARVRVLARRKNSAKSPLLRIADLEIDTASRKVRRGDSEVPLSAREYALLEFLAANPERIVTRAEIWNHVYDFHSAADSNVVDVFVGLLRKKIERPGMARLLHTRRGQGYMLGLGEDGE